MKKYNKNGIFFDVSKKRDVIIDQVMIDNNIFNSTELSKIYNQLDCSWSPVRFNVLADGIHIIKYINDGNELECIIQVINGVGHINTGNYYKHILATSIDVLEELKKDSNNFRLLSYKFI